VVVIRGRENVFCGGFDLTILRGDDDALKERMVEDGRALLKRLYLFPRPVILAVTGHAIAMGALLLLAGDVRVGLAGDFRVGLNETRIGLPLPASSVEIARDRLAPTVLQRATLNAELFTPEDAVSAGFLDQAVHPMNFDALVAAAAKSLALLDPTAFFETKLRVRQSAFERIAG
jgi:enoyl-CoA hydratase